ncbi:UNVERIFIED_CONTAM: hypothetical protein Sangu_0607400 [Sesamum angustifolium]|uniref:Uncharacterized protein n=1 Tax=Sesamum angustifolium TaxID=2727405 RepID=A0AAW2QBE4_9LAMI
MMVESGSGRNAGWTAVAGGGREVGVRWRVTAKKSTKQNGVAEHISRGNGWEMKQRVRLWDHLFTYSN